MMFTVTQHSDPQLGNYPWSTVRQSVSYHHGPCKAGLDGSSVRLLLFCGKQFLTKKFIIILNISQNYCVTSGIFVLTFIKKVPQLTAVTETHGAITETHEYSQRFNENQISKLCQTDTILYIHYNLKRQCQCNYPVNKHSTYRRRRCVDK